MNQTLAAAALAATTVADPALASDFDTVRAFYADIFTDPAISSS